MIHRKLKVPILHAAHPLPRAACDLQFPSKEAPEGLFGQSSPSTADSPEPKALLGTQRDALDQGQESTKTQAGAQYNSNVQVLGKEGQESYIKKKSPLF